MKRIISRNGRHERCSKRSISFVLEGTTNVSPKSIIMSDFFDLDDLGEILKDGKPVAIIGLVALGAFWAICKVSGK